MVGAAAAADGAATSLASAVASTAIGLGIGVVTVLTNLPGGGTGTTRRDESSCLSGGWSGNPIDYWSRDASNGDRATGADACLNATNMTGGTSASKFPPGYFWTKDYADFDLGLNSRVDINACHLIADILGGSGSNLENLATCSRGANTYRSNTYFAPMRAFERKVQAEASISGQSVYYRVVPLYEGSRTVPTGFMMYARSTTGWTDDITVGNVIVDQYGVPHNLGTATRSDGSIPVGAVP